MRPIFVLLFVQFCSVLSFPIEENQKLEEVEDTAVIAEATKSEKSSPHHEFKLKHLEHHKENDAPAEANVEKQEIKDSLEHDKPGLVEAERVKTKEKKV